MLPGQAFDLGHDDQDRSRYRGPEHCHENRAAGARKTNAIRRARRVRAAVTRLRW